MTRLTEFSLRQKSVIILLSVAVFLGGAYSWTTLKQELIPDIQLPFVMVISPMPGAGAEPSVTRPRESGSTGEWTSGDDAPRRGWTARATAKRPS